MPPSTQSHARSHALLLLQKLLNLRDNASPLTLILDTLEQSAKPLLQEFLSRAKTSKSKTIFLSFATLHKPSNVDIFIKARGKTPDALRAEVASHYPPTPTATNHGYRVVVVLDTLNALASAAPPSDLALFLSGLAGAPGISLVCAYHADVPLTRSFGEYGPHPLAALCHLATAVLRVGSLYQAVERRRARDRSQREPEWGLGEGREGVLVGLGGEKKVAAGAGLVLEMELRRRSGRAVVETFVLVPRTAALGENANGNANGNGRVETARLYLLSDHPAFRGPDDAGRGSADGEGDEMETTFNLGLTEKQRRDREGIVLPYFDAQTDIGAGEGGRILYEMGREDDFDDEEDEI